MFTSDTLTAISSKLLKKNGWLNCTDYNEKTLHHSFFKRFDVGGEQMWGEIHQSAYVDGAEVIYTDEWTLYIADRPVGALILREDDDMRSYKLKSPCKYMEDIFFLLDLCHISNTKPKL